MPDGQDLVFVVDDDEAVRKSLARLLRSLGLTVESFPSAGEFLAREHYDGVGCIVLASLRPRNLCSCVKFSCGKFRLHKELLTAAVELLDGRREWAIRRFRAAIEQLG
jgi:hypothetical protein